MKRIHALIAAASVIAAGLVLAGPLTPPAGPVVSTYKTLTEVEPRTAVSAANTPGTPTAVYQITLPGSYYLTANVVGAPGKSGIEILCGGVTLDLCGFDLVGGEGSADGVRIGSALVPIRNVAVRNGSLRAWGGLGLDGSASSAFACVFSDLTAQGNGHAGILAGDSSTLTRCVAVENGADGIDALGDCTLNGCATQANTQCGYSLSPGCVATGCTASTNSNSGFIAVSGGVTFSNCVSRYNTQRGFYVYVSYPNAGASLLTACTALGNSAEGFFTVDGTVISGCVSSGNAMHGFSVMSNCTIRGCTAESNGGATVSGILLQGGGNRPEDNTLIGNGYGWATAGGGNFIARNTSRASITAAFGIAAGNSAAPVITNPGSNAFATMTPWSNVAY